MTNLGAGRSTVVGNRSSVGGAGELSSGKTVRNLRRGSNSERGLEMDVHSIWKVRQRDNIDVVGRSRAGGSDCRWLDQTNETFAVSVDGVVDKAVFACAFSSDLGQ